MTKSWSTTQRWAIRAKTDRIAAPSEQLLLEYVAASRVFCGVAVSCFTGDCFARWKPLARNDMNEDLWEKSYASHDGWRHNHAPQHPHGLDLAANGNRSVLERIESTQYPHQKCRFGGLQLQRSRDCETVHPDRRLPMRWASCPNRSSRLPTPALGTALPRMSPGMPSLPGVATWWFRWGLPAPTTMMRWKR